MPSILHLIDRSDQFEAMAEEWTAFSDQCRLAATFCGPRSWIPWLRAHGNQEPAVFEWRRGGELKALVPMFRRGHHLEMAAGPHLDYQDVAAVDTASAVSAILAISEKESAGSSTILFPKVAHGSRLAAALKDAKIAELTHHESRYWSQCSVAKVERTDKGDFFAAIPSRQRKDYRNAARRISEAFPGHVVEHHGPGHFEADLIDEVGLLHRANQHRKRGDSIFADPLFVRFLREVAVSGAPLCLSLLRERPGGPLIAFHLGFFANDTFSYYLTSYAGEHAGLSPGRWLLVDALRHWFERIRGSSLDFDMLCGEEEYKSRWPVSTYGVDRVVLIPKRLANLPRILAYSAVYGLKNAKNRRLLGRRDGGRVNEPDPEDLVLPG